jgi:hypothetical protein
MNITRGSLNAIGWGTALAICFALTVVLTMRVNAVKSQVALADRQIAQLTQEKLYLETEFETRASQPQLRAMNDIDFGFVAPSAGQYLKSERDLAALGKPAGPDAPQPIRVAAATDSVASSLPAGGTTLAGRLIGAARAAEIPADMAAESQRQPLKVASLNERLSRLDRPAGARE